MSLPSLPSASKTVGNTGHTSDHDTIVTYLEALTNATALTTVSVVTASTFTAVAGTFIPVDTTSNSCVITLPTAPQDESRIGVKMIIQGITNSITINSGGSDVFNKTGGSTTETITAVNQIMFFQYSSGIWMVQDSLALANITNSLTNMFAACVATVNVPTLSGSGGSTTIASGSNTQTLPQATIYGVSTAGFPLSGTFNIVTGSGTQSITYTGNSGNTFTGCSGGTGTLSTGGAITATFDGYLLAAPSVGNQDLILLTAQTTASQNGPWLIPAGVSGAWTRPTEFASGATVKGRSVRVLNGTNYGNTEWTLVAGTGGLTVDTTSQMWALSALSWNDGRYGRLATKSTYTADQYFASGTPWVDVKAFRAKGDVQTITTASTTSSSAVITAPSGTFSSADVGKVAQIGTTSLVGTTIASYQSSTQVTLAANATSTVTGTATFTWGTDDSTAIQNAIAAAGAVGGTVQVPPPAYANGAYFCDSLLLNQYLVTLRAASLGNVYYGLSSKPMFGVRFLQKPNSSNTLMTSSFSGNTIEGICFDGNNNSGTGTLLAMTFGNTCRLREVTCINGGGIGLDITGQFNAENQRVFVYHCGANSGGTSTSPAVRFTPIDNTHAQNAVSFNFLDIEEPQGTPLEIGNYVTSAHNYPAYIRINDLHIEGAATFPSVLIANCLSVCFIDPFIFGGGSSAPLITYDLTDTTFNTANPGILGGVSIIGGTLLGNASSAPGGEPVNLIHLMVGNDFTMIGTRLLQCSGAAVLVDSGFGGRVEISPSVLTSAGLPVGSVLSDSRAAGANVTWPTRGTLLGRTAYTTGSGNTTYTVSNGSVLSIDGTNIALAITVPSNGAITVRFSVLCVVGTTSQTSFVMYTSGGAQVGLTQIITAAAGRQRITADFPITGLTPGPLTLVPYATANGTGNTLLVGQSAGPAVIEAYAA